MARAEPGMVPDVDGLRVTALGAPHSAPAPAYRVQVDDTSIVFSSDQTGMHAEFARFGKSG